MQNYKKDNIRRTNRFWNTEIRTEVKLKKKLWNTEKQIKRYG